MSTSRIKPYAIYDSVYDLQHVELYSGGELDPIVDATTYAQDNLAFDSAGNKLPFSLRASFNAQYLNREKNLLEDKDKKKMRLEQKVTVTIIVWETIEDYLFFESGETGWAEFL